LQRDSARKRSFFDNISIVGFRSMIIHRTTVLLRRFAKWNTIEDLCCLSLWISLILLLLYIILMLFSRQIFIFLVIRGIVYEIMSLDLVIFLSFIKYSNYRVKIVRYICTIFLGIVDYLLFHKFKSKSFWFMIMPNKLSKCLTWLNILCCISLNHLHNLANHSLL
jgi:Zn-dependent protease with chaperone function